MSDEQEEADDPPANARVIKQRVEFDMRSNRVLSAAYDEASGSQLQIEDDNVLGAIRSSLTKAFSQLAKGLEAEILAAAQIGDHRAAADILERGVEEGALALGAPPTLCDALETIDVGRLDARRRQSALVVRMELGSLHGDYTKVERDAKAYLDEFPGDDPATWNIVLIRANAASQAGKRELAQLLYQDILDSGSVDTGGKAWAARGLSLVLTDRSDEAHAAAERAADLFLASGDRKEAVVSLLGIVEDVEYRQPYRAAELIERALSLTQIGDDPSLFEIHLRAHVLKTKTQFLMRVDQPAEALVSAKEAVNLTSRLDVPAEEHIAALHMLREAARSAGEDHLLSEVENRIAATEPKASASYQTGAKVRAFVAGDTPWSPELEVEVRDDGTPNLILSYLIAVAVFRDTELHTRIEYLDEASTLLEQSGLRSDETCSQVSHAYAEVYRNAGQREKAYQWYRETLRYDPYHPVARQNAAALVLELQLWEEAVTFFQDELARHGEHPGILYGYGRALLGAGRAGEAISPLNRAVKARPDVAAFRKYLDQALAAADEIPPPVMADRRSEDPVRRTALEEALAQFGKLVRTTSRMSFWKSDGKKGHKWVARPEARATELLRMHLHGCFGEAMESFQEVHIGAGRADLLLMFRGGLRALVELKMCDGGYELNYATKGVDQLVHYMSNLDTSLGYLVVFDGRRRDLGKGLQDVVTRGGHTIYTRMVDVRPVVAQ